MTLHFARLETPLALLQTALEQRVLQSPWDQRLLEILFRTHRLIRRRLAARQFHLHYRSTLGSLERFVPAVQAGTLPDLIAGRPRP